MKRTIQGFLLAGTMLLGGAALAQDKPQDNKGSNKAGTAEFRGFMVPTDPKAMLERIHYTHQKEIKLGQLAQQNSTNADVKSFGESMVREHTDADQRLMSFAQSQGMKLSDMPKPMNDLEKKAMAADKANMEKLQALKGEPFDSCYMSNMVGDHDDTLGKLMAGRQAISGDAQLTSMMENLTQSVAQHRQHAYSVLGKLGPQAMGMGVGGAGTDTSGGTKGTTGSGMQKGTESGTGGHMGTGSGTTGSGSGTMGTGSGTTGSSSGTMGTGGTTGSGTQQKK